MKRFRFILVFFTLKVFVVSLIFAQSTIPNSSQSPLPKGAKLKSIKYEYRDDYVYSAKDYYIKGIKRNNHSRLPMWSMSYFPTHVANAEIPHCPPRSKKMAANPPQA